MTNKSVPVKVDLTLLNKLVREMNEGLKSAEEFKQMTTSDVNDYIVSLSKLLGVAAGISQEAIGLIGDITVEIRNNQKYSGDASGLDFMSLIPGAKSAPKKDN